MRGREGPGTLSRVPPSPELRVLLLSLRPEREPARARLGPLLPGVRWERLLGLARAHGASALLHALLGDEATVPPAAREELAERARLAAARALLQRDQARRVVDLLAGRGVEALVLKGPALAARWESPALRESGDLDLLVRRRDAARAWSALLESGWKEALPVAPRARRAVLRTEREHPFTGGGALPLDLHWGLFDPHSWPAPDEEALWSRAEPFEPGLRGLGRADALLFLCQHGAKHLWERLVWLADLARLAPGAPWAEVRAAARARGAERALDLALRLGREALDLSLPPGEALGGDHPALVPALRATRAAWEGGPPPAPADSLRLQLRLRAGARDRLRLALGELLLPTAEERALLPLPAPLDPLLAGLRLVRLTLKHT